MKRRRRQSVVPAQGGKKQLMISLVISICKFIRWIYGVKLPTLLYHSLYTLLLFSLPLYTLSSIFLFPPLSTSFYSLIILFSTIFYALFSPFSTLPALLLHADKTSWTPRPITAKEQGGYIHTYTSCNLKQ